MKIKDLPMDNESDISVRASELVAGLIARPWGDVSLSVYETGRLVALVPWLAGHRERVDYLLATQHADGGWGGPDGYGFVPTLSATEAMLSLVRSGPAAADPALIAAAGNGLRWLHVGLNQPGGVSWPDTPAIELIVPSLIARINEHVHHLPGIPTTRLSPPAGMGDRTLALLGAALAAGHAVPDKLLHVLEVAGPAAAQAPAVSPTSGGVIGASPAAAAAWLGDSAVDDPHHPVRAHLESVVRQFGGPVPVGTPITVFERSWVLSWLLRAGVPIEVPRAMVDELREAVGSVGAPAGPGLPTDADTTSVLLSALAMLGAPLDPRSLLAYETPTHFQTWPGEQGFSTSVNAHALDAFGQYLRHRPEAGRRYAPTVAKLSALLRQHQEPDGSWTDRWHASPFYATVSCALALAEFGGPASTAAVHQAVRWVLDTQREDGSWGHWTGTREETAYALQILLLSGAPREARSVDAAARGCLFLARSEATDDPPLWIDKDLYHPVTIVRAAELAACHLAWSDPVVGERVAALRPEPIH